MTRSPAHFDTSMQEEADHRVRVLRELNLRYD